MDDRLLPVKIRKSSLKGVLQRAWWNSRRRDWILGRHACLGNDVLALSRPAAKVFNIQKGRVDYLDSVSAGPSERARTRQVAPFLANPQILPFILQQEYGGWLPDHPPLAIYMDSFAELADQMFCHRADRWKFCAAYSDLAHGPAFESAFSSEGLMPVEDLRGNYGRFFERMRAKYGKVPVFFLHFPARLEKREKFRLRKQAIEEAIASIKSAFEPFHTVSVDEGNVGWPEEKVPGIEDFPYHYDKDTYAEFRAKLDSIDAFRACGGGAP